MQLSSGSGIANIDAPVVHRFGAQLQIAWTQDSTPGTTALHTRVLNANGSTASGDTTVVDWAAVNQYPAIISNGANRVLVFGGIQDTTTSNPLSSGKNFYVTSPDGVSWSAPVGTLGSSPNDDASYGSGAVDAGGTPISVTTPGTTHDVSYNAGFDAIDASSSDPATADQTTQANPKCCAYYAGVNYDATNGQTWAAWYTNTGDAATDGIDAQQIYPTPGAMLHAPRSTTNYAGSISSVSPDQGVSVAARVGGGLYTAYGVGYPTQKKVALWKLGSAEPTLVTPPSGGSVAYPVVTSGPGGTLWLAWVNQGAQTIQAVRTNSAGTVLGKVCSVPFPQKNGTVFGLAADGSNGLLDLVVNEAGLSTAQIYSTQTLPCLSAKVSPSSLKASKGGKVTVTVTDAGVPVKGVKVKLGGITKTTNAKGKAVFSIKKKSITGTRTVTVGKSGYTGLTLKLRVT